MTFLLSFILLSIDTCTLYIVLFAYSITTKYLSLNFSRVVAFMNKYA